HSQILSHYSQLTEEDLQAVFHYAAETLKQVRVYPPAVWHGPERPTSSRRSHPPRGRSPVAILAEQVPAVAEDLSRPGQPLTDRLGGGPRVGRRGLQRRGQDGPGLFFEGPAVERRQLA